MTFFQKWIVGWIKIIDGLIAVFSLGIVSATFALDMIVYFLKHDK